MIILNVIQNDEKSAQTIAAYLLEEKFASQVHVDVNTIYNGAEGNQTIRLFFITKSLLYDIIEAELVKLFPSKEMIIYATPVTHINKYQGEAIRKNIRAA
jgi:uncharacterized protein involved in tolerance to divalent cations